jgi:D-alanyl-D-alanine carboxypeptidase/D-alanyl-D-alanine-endopeptidase (penicillin-binding protein 4)
VLGRLPRTVLIGLLGLALAAPAGAQRPPAPPAPPSGPRPGPVAGRDPVPVAPALGPAAPGPAAPRPGPGTARPGPKAAPATQPAGAARPTAPASRPRVVTPADAARRAALRERLTALLASKFVRQARVGVHVLTGDGDVLFSHLADTPYEAASNTKLLTTGAALTFLGGAYQLRTTLAAKAPDDHGVIHGDLYLRGAGDPFFSSADLHALAKSLAARKVRRITGGIVVDESVTGKEPGRGTGTLSVDHSTFRVVVAPGKTPKARPHVAVGPSLPRYFKIVNRATTVKKGKMRLQVTTRDDRGHTVVFVSGRIPLRHAPVAISRNPRHGGLFAAYSLQKMLDEQGVTVGGSARAGRAPKDAVVLAEHKSRSLAAIARPVNKDSNNFLAERVFQILGAEIFGGPATAAKGAQAVAQFLEKLGFTKPPWHQVDGSGLSHSNRFSPAFLAELLRRLVAFDARIFADLWQSLAVGGKEGTIRHRFRGTVADGAVFGKTGTLRGVSCLSGYVKHTDRLLVFAILVNNIRGRVLKGVRQTQVEMVNAMYRYLAGDAASRPAPGVPPPEMDREGVEEPVFDEEKPLTDDNAAPASQPADLKLLPPEMQPPALPTPNHGPSELRLPAR